MEMTTTSPPEYTQVHKNLPKCAQVHQGTPTDDEIYTVESLMQKKKAELVSIAKEYGFKLVIRRKSDMAEAIMAKIENRDQDLSPIDALELAKDTLKTAFNAFGMDPEPLIEDVIRDPYSFRHDKRPIVKALYTALLKETSYRKGVATMQATASLEMLKEYFDDSVEALMTKATSMFRRVSEDRDIPLMRELCEKSYIKGYTAFILSAESALKDRKPDPMPIPMDLNSTYETLLQSVLGVISSKRTSNPGHINMLECHINRATTLDNLRWIISGQPEAWNSLNTDPLKFKLPSKFRDAGIAALQEYMLTTYMTDIGNYSTADETKGFRGYCFKEYSRIVREGFYFNGDPLKNSVASYLKFVNDWKDLTDDEKDEYY
jgi:hypothetical protein